MSPAGACVAAFHDTGPLPNVANHHLLISRMGKLVVPPTLPPVIYLPGGGGLETSWQDGTSTNPNAGGDALRGCIDHGYYRRRGISLPTDWTWGNDTMQTRIDDVLTYAEAHYNFAPPYHLVGASMGTTCALNWAINNLDKVQSIACMLPAVNIQEIVDDGLADTFPVGPPNVYPPDDPVAYGVRPPDDHNPASYATDLVDVPIKLWYSSNDSICLPAEVVSFAADSGAETVNCGSQSGFVGVPGHNLGFDPGHLLWHPNEVTNFLAAHE